MITVNGKTVELEEITTGADLLYKPGFAFPLIVMRINGELVNRSNHGETRVADGGVIDVIHMMSRG